MRYPSECPVFEVVWSDPERIKLPIGQHVEGVIVEPWMLSVYVRFAEYDAIDRAATVLPREVRPLTRAAREMLALVRE